MYYLCSIVLTLLLVVITSIIIYFKYRFSYWSKQNVVFIPPVVPFGNFQDFVLQKCSFGENVRKLYNQLKKMGQKYGGLYLFSQPSLLITDPELLKNIMTKDFHHFSSRGTYSNEQKDPLSAHLLNLNGDRWKMMRSKLTPTFTSGKLKMMFQTLVACTEEFQTVLEEHSNNKTPLDVKDTTGRFTTDIIGSCAFGIECNSLKDPDNEFRKFGKKVFETSVISNIRRLLANEFPRLFTLLSVNFNTDSKEFFLKLVNDTVNYRIQNNVKRNDFMQLLIQLMEDNTDDDNKIDGEDFKLTINQIAAQAFVFFLAGFETASTTLCSFMYEMTQHQDVQDKLRNEIHQTLKKYDGKLTYEGISEMNYLDKVIDETLRLHATAPSVRRKCVEDYKIPDSDFVIKKGSNITIPIAAFHLDPEYYPNPTVFDPERFNQEEKNKRHPYTFLPFGAGPRNCIGMRFGKMQVKVGIIALLKNYRFTLNSKTQLPIKEDPSRPLYTIKGGIWVNAEKI